MTLGLFKSGNTSTGSCPAAPNHRTISQINAILVINFLRREKATRCLSIFCNIFFFDIKVTFNGHDHHDFIPLRDRDHGYLYSQKRILIIV